MAKRPTRKLAAWMLAAAVSLYAMAAWAGDSITASTSQDGRTIFVNSSDTPHPYTKHSTQESASNDGTRYVYWSNTAHRWKAVPANLIVRRARTAAAEVMAAAKPGKGDTGESYVSSEKVNQAIELAAARNNVDPDLVRAVIKVESNFNPRAVSRKGAMGLMQLMPSTARSLNVAHPFDPTENVDAGVRHLRKLMDDFGGNLANTLAAYNAGSKAVEEHGGIPPYRETQDYVRRITAMYHGGDLLGAPSRRPIRITRDTEGHLLFSNTE